MMDGKVILIEGLDLAGKSTLVRHLRDELVRRGLTVRVSRNALCPENPIAPIADALRRDPEAGLVETGALFLASHLWDARHFRRPAARTVHLQDSCWLRTLAYHTARGTPGVPQLLLEAVPTFPQFDVAVFLTAGIGERQRRLDQREQERPGSNDLGDRAVVSDPEEFVRVEATLQTLAVNLVRAVVLDSTGLGLARILESAVAVIDRKVKLLDSAMRSMSAQDSI